MFKMNTHTLVLVFVLIGTLSLIEHGCSGLTQGQEQELLDAHNFYRRKIRAADTKMMIWNSELARMAQVWANKCLYYRGNVRKPGSQRQVGQIIMIVRESLTETVGKLYGYGKYYRYDKDKECTSMLCRKHVQFAWSRSFEVGCATSKCRGMELLVCNYDPIRGSLNNEYPYQKGEPCSRCEPGHSWCSGGLCVTQSQCMGIYGCDCAVTCHNCAVFNYKTCSCECKRGYIGLQCEDKCEDRHVNCGRDPGYPAAYCSYPAVNRTCPALCRACTRGYVSKYCRLTGPGARSISAKASLVDPFDSVVLGLLGVLCAAVAGRIQA